MPRTACISAPGEVLVELDAAEAGADYTDAIGAPLPRLPRDTAAPDDRPGRSSRGDHRYTASIDRPEDIPPAKRAREELRSARRSPPIRGRVKSLKAPAHAKKAEQKRLTETIAAQQTLIATLQSGDHALDLAGHAVRHQVGRDRCAGIPADPGNHPGHREGPTAEALAAADVLAQEREKAIETFKADNGHKLAEAGTRSTIMRKGGESGASSII